jgi:hypothetical protein
MDDILTCPSCHQPVGQTDYFCPYCGKKIRPQPLSTSWGSQIVLYIKTLLLPPLGLWWGYRYLRQSDTSSKLVGLVVVLMTVVEIVWVTQITIGAINTANQQINQQMNLYGL